MDEEESLYLLSLILAKSPSKNPKGGTLFQPFYVAKVHKKVDTFGRQSLPADSSKPNGSRRRHPPSKEGLEMGKSWTRWTAFCGEIPGRAKP